MTTVKGPAGQLKGRAARLANLMPSGTGSAARAPFVLLVVLLLAGGLITLLLLNSSLNEGSFRLSKLKDRTTELTDEQQALQRDVDDRSEPGALAGRARELGMVPGGNPAFLRPDGRILGKPDRAAALPRPRPTTSTTATPSASADPSGTPSPGTAGSPSPTASPDSTTRSTPTATTSVVPVPAAGGTASPTTSPGR